MAQALRVLSDGDSPSSASRVFVHPSVLRQLRLQAASPARIELTGIDKGNAISQNIFAEVWPRSSISADEVIVNSAFISVSDIAWKAQITSIELAKKEACPPAENISLLVERVGTRPSLNSSELTIVKSLARQRLLGMGYVSKGQRWNLEWLGEMLSIQISAISANGVDTALDGQATRLSRVALIQPLSATAQDAKTVSNGVLDETESYATLGGLDPQIREIRRLVELPLRQPELFKRYGLQPPGGLLLFGPPGTGKTSLAISAAKACVEASSIETISGPELSSSLHGGTERALRKVFDRARKKAPSVVIIDEIDALAPRRDGDVEGAGEVEKRVVATLLTLMDGLNNGQDDRGRVVVIAATNRPNALDPALRRPGRLDREIEIGIPRSDDRLAILKVLMKGVPHRLSDEEIADVAAKTHGFVGADLSSLVREAGMNALTRHLKTSSESLESRMQSLALQTDCQWVTYDDFIIAQTKIRPSAMREISLELPKVTWAEIATGNSGKDVQRTLRECVEWPLKHGDTMKRLGVQAPRGVLLYGPPGCSKTLIARALASESGLNFVAVKGGELLNKYVGESERALREIFRKARAASPSIIFFDELDGLTTSRGAEGGSVGDRLITTLLNEMDGIEQLANVLVVAATNRPDVLDSALLRPGRLDKLLYVGPPDTSARMQILQIRSNVMALARDVDLKVIAEMTDGCSGAEMVSICQEAGLRAMNDDINAVAISQSHLEAAAKSVRRRITPSMIRKYEAWRDQVAI